eukprot:3284219-Rhodomonas_salina.2
MMRARCKVSLRCKLPQPSGCERAGASGRVAAGAGLSLAATSDTASSEWEGVSGSEKRGGASGRVSLAARSGSRRHPPRQLLPQR